MKRLQPSTRLLLNSMAMAIIARHWQHPSKRTAAAKLRTNRHQKRMAKVFNTQKDNTLPASEGRAAGCRLNRPRTPPMAEIHHTKAAEHHEAAAKSHKAAAEKHGKDDHAAAHTESTKAHGASEAAHKSSSDAHSKSAALKK